MYLVVSQRSEQRSSNSAPLDAPMSMHRARASCHERALLLHGWSLCSTAVEASPVDTAGGVAPGEGVSWLSVPTLAPVAAVHREVGCWSLDAPPLRFDAAHWWYRLRFDAVDEAGCADVFLGFDGLATLAQVWLNGALLLSSNNMFVSAECAVGNLLRPIGNELLIRFASLDAALATRRPRPRWRVPMIEHQQLRWVRTTVLGRTPGWSPPCAVVGPWRDIWLERRHGFSYAIRRIESTLDRQDGVVELECELQADDGVAEVQLLLDRKGLVYVGTAEKAAGGLWRVSLRVPAAALWWPHTHGEPALYGASLRVTRGASPDVVVDLGRIGFRTIALDSREGNFALSVNQVPVFCRGACWTPTDPVTLRGDSASYRRAIELARDAGMNMLRVTGTAAYEDAAFFDACDEYGMLVWQDFMFANMDFPADDPGFLDSIRTEVKQQLHQWQGRPSLALLCGNSEVSQQAAMWGAAREAWAVRLFNEEIAALSQQALPGTPYWPSSAWGGAFPHQVDRGTTSYYGVGAYQRPLDDARRSGLRFATECLAFANVPDELTLSRVPGQGGTARVTHPGWKLRSPRDLGAGWDFDDVRDHYLKRLFGVDPAELRYSDHARYLTLSRMTTAEVMVQAFSEWRRHGSTCTGALVLFLRDLWAGAGWGLLDDQGRPKSCWHALCRTLQPRAVLVTDEGNSGLVAHLINERPEAFDAKLSFAAWRNDVVISSGSRDLRIPERSSQAIALMELSENFFDLNHAFRFGPRAHDTVVVSLNAADGPLLSRAFHFPGGIGLPADPALGLGAMAKRFADGSLRVVVGSRHVAVGVHFDVPGYVADDEFFHLLPGETREVILRPQGGATPRTWYGSVSAVNSVVGSAIVAAS